MTSSATLQVECVIGERIAELSDTSSEHRLKVANFLRECAVAFDDVGRDSTTIVDNAARGRAIPGSRLRSRTLILVTVELLANRAARRRVPARSSDFQPTDFAEWNHALRASLPVRRLADDDCAIVILECARDNLSRARALLVDEDRQRKLRPLLRGAVTEIAIRFGNASAKADDFLTGSEEQVGNSRPCSSNPPGFDRRSRTSDFAPRPRSAVTLRETSISEESLNALRSM